MKIFNQLILFLAVILLQSCSDNDDADCSSRLCYSGPATFRFEIVNVETGENLIGSLISADDIKVQNTLSFTTPDYRIITENDLNLLQISNSASADFKVLYENETIFTFSVDAEQRTDDCCSFVEGSEIKIEGADYELNEDTGIYQIKKVIRSHIVTGETNENYHAFFENSKLEIIREENGDANERISDMDVTQGDQLVFKLLRHEEGNPEIADDEITTIVYFSIDPGAKEFTLTSQNFAEANAVLGLTASSSIIKPITQGTITGSKISDSEWQVSINVSTDEDDQSGFIQIEESQRGYLKSTYEDVWMPVFSTHVFR